MVAMAIFVVIIDSCDMNHIDLHHIMIQSTLLKGRMALGVILEELTAPPQGADHWILLKSRPLKSVLV